MARPDPATTRPMTAPSGRSAPRPAWYAAGSGPWRDWVTVLHLPYTAWHLAYVLVGAGLAASVDPVRLIGTLLAFALAVGVAAHALDELKGRPLGTAIPATTLAVVAGLAGAGAVALGVVGIGRIGWGLAGFIAVGVVLVVGYNLEIGGGVLHTDTVFAAAMGCLSPPHRVLRPDRDDPAGGGGRGGVRLRPVAGPAGPQHRGPPAPPTGRAGRRGAGPCRRPTRTGHRDDPPPPPRRCARRPVLVDRGPRGGSRHRPPRDLIALGESAGHSAWWQTASTLLPSGSRTNPP